jgi:hypothetical protein
MGRRAFWALATGLAVGAGFTWGFVIMRLVDVPAAALGLPRLTGYFSALVMVGALVGLVQSVLLPARGRWAWILNNAVAVPPEFCSWPCVTSFYFVRRRDR